MTIESENPAMQGGARNVSSHLKSDNDPKDTRTYAQKQPQNLAAQLAKAAQDYRDQHGRVPLRLEGKLPDCMGAGWNKRTLEHPVPKFKDGDNIGILLGEPSGDLVRLDPDYPALAGGVDLLWPEPTWTYGRKSSPRSGRLYISKAKSQDFKLPPSMKDDPRLPPGNDGQPSLVVYQVLGTGKQTMVPPSIHPESGEEVVWQKQIAPVALEASELTQRAGLEAFLMAVAHFWPPRGTRNEAAWSLTRVLLEVLAGKYPNDDERIALVDELVLEVAMVGGDGEESRKGKERGRKTLDKMRAGKKTTGLPHLVTLLGLPADVTNTFRSWLGVKETYADRLNETHAVVRVGAKTVILDDQPGQPPQFMTQEDFHLWYANNQIAVSPDKTIAVSRLWITDPRRRQYTRVVFDPTDNNPDHFNMWRGFAVKPDPTKSCEKFLAHIKDNICSKDEKIYQWVMGFLAHMVQRPWEKPGVALVLRGREGVGKGFLVRWIGRLFPEHYVALSQATHLTGRFNAHLQQALLVFVDEAFWAGDKQGQGALYRLVTDTETLIEPKFVTAFMVKSLLRLIIASNERWVVPAGVDARRWGVLDVAETHMNDRAYFGAIETEMENGGLEVLMHTLLTFDLGSVDVYTAPKTAALLEQKEDSLPPHERWWFECLQEGRIEHPYDDNLTSDDWPKEIVKDRLWCCYANWAERHNVRSRRWPDSQLHKWLNKNELIPGSSVYQPHGKKRLLRLPGLEACRKAYAAHIGQPIAWQEEEGAPQA
jgi:Family of unknown function (DUF5906)